VAERNFKKVTGMNDQQIAESGKDAKAALKVIGTQERAVAVMSCAALTWIEAGNIDQAKKFLGRNIADYYRTYQKMEDAAPDRDKFLKRVESSTSPTIKAALAEKP
jgi:hypothetical protein